MTMQLLLNKNTGDDARVYIMRQEIAESENGGGDSTKILRLFDRMMAQPQASTDIAILYATYMSLKKMPQEKIEAVLEKVLAQTPDNAAARLQLVAYAWQRFDDANVPPWAMKVVLDEEEFTGAAARPQSTLADALAEEDDLYRDLNNS